MFSLFHSFLLSTIIACFIADTEKVILESNEELTQSTQFDAAKSGQRWEDKEILMFLSCYEKFLHRFQKKRVSEKRIWTEVRLDCLLFHHCLLIFAFLSCKDFLFNANEKSYCICWKVHGKVEIFTGTLQQHQWVTTEGWERQKITVALLWANELYPWLRQHG
jgi:hypothetical protein